MTEHTPGPWKIVSPKEGGCLDQKENRLIGTTINNHPYHIAETFQYRNGEFNAPDGVSLANARLIAAAPDLLAACKNAVKQMEDEPVQAGGDWERGLFCGLEDMDITDRYMACRHGYDKALEKVQEWIIDEIEAAIEKEKA